MNSCAPPYFTIITPVYNAAPFLENTVQCILRQSFSDFELILIDDQSQDNSWDLCQKFSALDSRVKCFQTPQNGGASAARNVGLSHVNGQFLIFIDADDEVPQDYLKKLHGYSEDYDCDCIKFGLKEIYFNGKGKLIRTCDCYIQSGLYKTKIDIFRQMVSLELIPAFGYLWNSIYKVSLIKEHHLLLNSALKINEDFEFNIRYFQYVRSLCCVNYCGYSYAKRVDGNSLSTAHNERYYELHMMKINQFLAIYDSLHMTDQQTLSSIFWMYTRFIYSTIQRAMEDKQNLNSLLFEIKRSDLYMRFMKVALVGLPRKARMMIHILRNLPTPILLAAVVCISTVKQKYPGFFSMIKR